MHLSLILPFAGYGLALAPNVLKPVVPSLRRQFHWKTSLATEIAVIELGQPA